MSSHQRHLNQELNRDHALDGLVHNIPYLEFMGIDFTRMGDELTGAMRYDRQLIGNPLVPALHGGAIGAFLETTALMQLVFLQITQELDSGGDRAQAIIDKTFPAMPKTIDLTIDYLRSGLPRNTYARAHVMRRGRRVANIRVEAWQKERAKPIAAAHGHFLLTGASLVAG